MNGGGWMEGVGVGGAGEEEEGVDERGVVEEEEEEEDVRLERVAERE